MDIDLIRTKLLIVLKKLLENLEPSTEGKLIAYKATLTEKFQDGSFTGDRQKVLEKIDDAEAIATEIEEASDLRVLMREAIANNELASSQSNLVPVIRL